MEEAEDDRYVEAEPVGGRWVEYRGYPGWEDFKIRVEAKFVAGDATATGVQVIPVDENSRVGLTSQRLRRLPVLDLARQAVMFYLPVEPEMRDGPIAAEVLASATPEEREAIRLACQGRSSRAAVPLEDFVTSWAKAFHDPKREKGTRETVCDKLKISARTYDRYRKQAEAAGLMPSREGRSK